MGTLTLKIQPPAPSYSSHPHELPDPFLVTVDSLTTVKHLKQVVLQYLARSPILALPFTLPPATDLGLVFDGHILNDTDTLDKVFEKVDCATSLPHIHLIVPLSGSKGILEVNEPCSPAPLHFNDQFTSPAPVSTYCSHELTSPSRQRTTTTTSTPAEESGTPTPVLAPFQYQYVLVNGMPYLAPSYYIPHLHMQQFAISGHPAAIPPSELGFNSPVNGLHQQNQPQPQREAGAAVALEGNAQDQAARGQRRAASLWLLLKLAFGVYLFSQNGSIERIVLLHIAALIIFLHQTGRLRIVRRVPRPPQEAPRDPGVNAAGVAEQPPASLTNQPTTPAQASSTPATTSNACDASNTASSSVSSKEIDHSKNDDDSQVSDEMNRSAKLDPAPTVSLGQDTATTASAMETTDSQNTCTAAEQIGSTAAITPPAAAAAAALPEEQRVSTWRYVEHGILTFIASLIPAPPPENEQQDANAVAAAERAL
ncbi:hypothetical protein KI688_012080 [Linnemannia hyalina]|uniref:Ubiquitin-like domain-containing protein n=1 Tax=Linnemannia hyalina TaxID=64524 RepID=A0A9P7XVD4_9FUNG|nr:hypothetical protein KI688_012080 [Linnemannia hyalina]